MVFDFPVLVEVGGQTKASALCVREPEVRLTNESAMPGSARHSSYFRGEGWVSSTGVGDAIGNSVIPSQRG